MFQYIQNETCSLVDNDIFRPNLVFVTHKSRKYAKQHAFSKQFEFTTTLRKHYSS